MFLGLCFHSKAFLIVPILFLVSFSFSGGGVRFPAGDVAAGGGRRVSSLLHFFLFFCFVFFSAFSCHQNQPARYVFFYFVESFFFWVQNDGDLSKPGYLSIYFCDFLVPESL